MSRKEILEEIAKRIERDSSELSEDMRFKEDLQYDSIDLVEMLMEIEGECGVDIPDEDAVNIKTIGDFIDVTLKAKNG